MRRIHLNYTGEVVATNFIQVSEEAFWSPIQIMMNHKLFIEAAAQRAEKRSGNNKQ
ncbi:MAG: hypothetical protein ACO1QB_13170 [Verrucomicrobiales bacterium]